MLVSDIEKLYFTFHTSFCNDLFSRFEQQILFLGKLAETTDPTTDHHWHDGPSRGSRSKTLRILKFGYWNRLSELRDEVAGRTVTGMTGRHSLLNKSSLWTLWWKQQDGPSQARRAVTVCVIPGWVGFLLNTLRGVLDYSCYNYKFSGLMLII